MPRSQKVVVGSPVLFTCVSDSTEEIRDIRWTVNDRDAQQEGVEVRRMGQNSALRIHGAQIKRDKRVYTCTVTYADGRTEEAHTQKLKVLAPTRE